MKAATRLRRALKRLSATTLAERTDAAGLDARTIGRAMAGRDLKALDYLSFCQAFGIDPETGSPTVTPMAAPIGISWHLLGMSLIIAQRSRGDLAVREIARRTDLSPATITRARCGEELSTDSFLAICAWLGVAPDHFVIFHEIGSPITRAA
jgi:hypothetical protein